MCIDGCSLIGSIFVSFIFGILMSLIFYFGLITNITFWLWIILAISILKFVLAVIKYAFLNEYDECDCKYGLVMIVSSMLSGIVSMVLLGATLTAGSILDALGVGVFGFFAIFMIITFVMYLFCKIVNNCNCGCR